MADDDNIPGELLEPGAPSAPNTPSAPSTPGTPGTPGLPGEEESYPGVSQADLDVLNALRQFAPAPQEAADPTEEAPAGLDDALDMGDMINNAINSSRRIEMDYLVGNRRSSHYGSIVTYLLIPYIWDAPAGSHGAGYFWGHDLDEDCIKSFFISNIQSVRIAE